MIKFIFPLMSGEKDELFLSMENEAIIKYIKDNEKLNSVKGDVTYLFDLFLYLYNVFKNVKNDELYELFEYILNIFSKTKIKKSLKDI